MLDTPASPLARGHTPAIDDIFNQTIEIRRKGTIVRQGEPCRVVRLLRQGLAIRYAVTADGDRQIVGLVFPGSLCDFGSIAFRRSEFQIESQTDCEVGVARLDDVIRRFDEDRALGWEMLSNALVETSVARAWIANLGRRSSHQRVAHLLCEVFARTRSADFARGRACSFPFTQQDVADIVGFTIVCVNRTLQDFRRAGLIEISSKVLRILDWERLSAEAGFDPGYLHSATEVPAISRAMSETALDRLHLN